MVVKIFRDFMKFEAAAGVLLFLAAVAALIIDNSPWSHAYRAFFDSPVSIDLGVIYVVKPVLLWVNDGLMAIFFLLIGLEIKREIFEGELNDFAKTSLPFFAAIGGVIIPACFYWYCNHHDSQAIKGWAIPVATDIAFSLAVLSLLGSRITSSLRVFLTALAIFDDIAAIIIIGIFYTQGVSVPLLLVAGLMALILLVLNRLNITSYAPYFIVGFILWLCVLKSGVHATLAGIIIAFSIPLKSKKNKRLSPVKRLEHSLHPWVAYAILPVFAFANAGISFAGVTAHTFFNPITVGILLGLFVGKQIGVFLASYLAIKIGVAARPNGMTYLQLYGISLLAGVGFTMSLFIGGLSFPVAEQYAPLVRLGVIIGSLLSGIAGYLVLYFSTRKKAVPKFFWKR